jgi:hypothetical protein
VGFLVKAVCSCCTSSRSSPLPPPPEDPAPLYTAPTSGYTGYAYTGPSSISLHGAYNGSYNGYSAYAAVPGLDPAAVPTTPTGTHYTSLPEGSPPQVCHQSLNLVTHVFATPFSCSECAVHA